MCANCNTYYAAVDTSLISSSANVLHLNFVLLPQVVESQGIAIYRDVDHVLCMCLVYIIWGIKYFINQGIYRVVTPMAS